MRRLALTLGVFALTGCHVAITSTLGPGSSHDGGTIASNEIWAAGAHAVSGDITVSGATLTIEPGSTITMAPDSSITIANGGTLAVLGTSAARVVFTTEHATAGDWYGIYIDGSANNASIIQNANILYAGKGAGEGAGLTVKDGGTLTLSYTRIESAKDYGLQLQGRTTLSGFSNNVFVHNGLGPALVDPDSAGQLKASLYTPNDLEGVVVQGGTLAHDATWLDLGVPYVTNNLTIETAAGTATLSLNANVIVQALPDTYWDVNQNGALVANGNNGHPVIFSSSKKVPAPGDWYEISFEDGSIGASNKLNYVIVEYGGGNPADQYGEIWLGHEAKVAITNSIIQQSGNYGINALRADSPTSGGKLPGFANNEVSGNAGIGVAVTANAVDGLQSSSLYGPNGATGVLVGPGTVAHNATWRALDTPYVVDSLSGGSDALTVGLDSGASTTTLTLDAGSEIRFARTYAFDVRQRGTLVAQGTSAAHVTLTAESPSDGWYELDVRSSAGNSLSYVDFRYGGKANYGQLWVANGAQIDLNHVSFASTKDSALCDVYLEGGSVSGSNNGSYNTCPL